MTARAILRLFPKAARARSGTIRFQDDNVFEMPAARLRAMRGGAAAMVFQDPMTSFNPVLRIGAQIAEALRLHADRNRTGSVANKVADLLRRVGIHDPNRRARGYPHEFSGGMRQRALIAMAVANGPNLLIADEPTTALDVTVQDQIMDLLRDLNERSGMSILLITHNIAVVASLCSRVIVMYAGRVVEDGPTETVLANPSHPYTALLLQSVPRVDREQARLVSISGQPPDPAAPPAGCRFHPRCPYAEPLCIREEPELDALQPGHRARCWKPLGAAQAPRYAEASL
jgi:oligopeptide/dipeptide ABC transporter ATP-binding protein